MTPDRPRILHVSSTYPPLVIGGAEKVVEQLAEAQARVGHRVGVAYLVPRSVEDGMRNGVTTLPQPNRNLIWMQDVLTRPRPLRTVNKLHQMVNLRSVADFEDAVRRFGADIVHTHSMVELPPQIWARSAAAGARVVHTLHDYDLICSRATRFRSGRNCAEPHASCRILGRWKAHWARSIDAVAAVSTPVLNAHREAKLFGHLPDEAQRVVWNAVGVPRLTKRPYKGGPFTFGFLGRLVEEKGIDLLLGAAHRLPDKGWRLRIAGKSPIGTAAIGERARGLPVSFEGFRPAADFLDRIDVLVVPSIWREPFGLTVVEAYARHVPVIGADIGAIGELVGTVGREWLVPPGNEAALARRMTEAIAAGRDALPPVEAFDPILAATAPDRMRDAYGSIYASLLADRTIAA